MGQQIEQQKNYIKKHVATIHCSNTLSLLQRKISNGLLHHAYPRLQQQEEHQITVRQLCNVIGYNGNNHKAIKDALRGLLTTIIEWNIVNQVTGEEDWTASTFLASVRIKGAICSYAYSPRMREMLYSPLVFGKINLIIQARFKSSYGLALYENCVRYRDLPATGWFDLETFRKLMGVTRDTYVIFRDFKRRVLDKSIEEVNMYSDLFIEPEIKRIGHTVQSIRFKLKEREKKKRIGMGTIEEGDTIDVTAELSLNENSITAKLQHEFGFSKTQIQKLLQEFDEEFIREKITIIQSSNSFIAGKITNLAAYLLDSLKKDYKKAASSQIMMDVRQKQQLQQTIIEDNLLKEQEVLQKKYSAYVAEQYAEKFNSLAESEKEFLLQEFVKQLEGEGSALLLTQYRKSGLENKILQIHFHNFIKNAHQRFIPLMMNYEEFVSQSISE